MSNTLHLFTMSYPFGNGEPFLENELNYLATRFKSIYIYPSENSASKRSVPDNVSVVELNADKINFSTLNTVIKNFGLIIYVHVLELMNSKKKTTYLKYFREFNSRLCKSFVLAERINDLIKKIGDKNDVYYSFWMNTSAEALAILKCRKKINRFVFRANGFDLYDVQTKHNYIPFRPFIFKQADKVFAVAKKGSDYMRSFNIFPEKITYSYFGTPDNGLAPFDPTEKFTILTCSDLRKVKRAEAMVDILKYVDFPIKWIHHGDKGDSEQIFNEKVKTLPSNIEFILHARKEDYGDVMKFMKENHFNLFVLLSSSEGLPVSLLEAMSFGIPLLATDVGGVSEVVNEKNGMLIEKDFKPEEVAGKIKNFSKGNMNTKEFREKVRTDWEKRFSATNNYEKFYLNLINYELS